MSETSTQDPVALEVEGPEAAEEEMPLGQRLLDSPFLLLAAGLFVMFLFYTGWGVVELMRLTPAPLP